MENTRERFRLTIQDQGDSDAPVDVRLRKLLKMLLRWLGFRCLDIISVGNETPPAAGGAGGFRRG
jgi:hypothetical protein